MLTRRLALTTVAFLLAGLGSASATAPVAADEPPTYLAVVVSKNTELSELSLHELRRIYLGERVDAAGRRLIPINYAPMSRDRVGFDRAVLGMSPDEAARYWIDRKIRGESGPPVTVETADVLQRVVTRLDGAIGYVRVGALSDQVKVIRIDGKAPTDADYPVRY
jgi:hypothetical protein